MAPMEISCATDSHATLGVIGRWQRPRPSDHKRPAVDHLPKPSPFAGDAPPFAFRNRTCCTHSNRCICQVRRDRARNSDAMRSVDSIATPLKYAVDQLIEEAKTVFHDIPRGVQHDGPMTGSLQPRLHILECRLGVRNFMANQCEKRQQTGLLCRSPHVTPPNTHSPSRLWP